MADHGFSVLIKAVSVVELIIISSQFPTASLFPLHIFALGWNTNMNFQFILVTRKSNIINKLIQTSCSVSCLYCCENHFLTPREARIFHVIQAIISKCSCCIITELNKKISVRVWANMFVKKETETDDMVRNSSMIQLLC